MPALSEAEDRRGYVVAGLLFTIVGAIGFSGKTVIVKLAYQHGVDALTLLALRMLFALPLFLLMAWWAGAIAGGLTRREWLAVAALGFIGYYLGSYLDFAGLQYISASLGRLILYLYPTLVLVLSAVALGQAATRRQLASLGLSYAGIALAFHAEVEFGDDFHRVALGAGLVFAGAVTYAVYLIAGSRLVLRLGSMRFTAYASTAASGFVLAHYAAVRGVAGLAATPEVYGLVLLMAVFSTVLPLWFMAEGLKRIGANQVALVGCIGPLSTIALAHFFLGEPVTAAQLAGAGLVLAGVLLISVRPRATVA